MAEMMECDELVEKLTDYLEDELRSEDPARLELHLSRCTGCQAHVNQVEVTLQLMSSLTGELMSDEFESSLVAVYHRWAESVSP